MGCDIHLYTEVKRTIDGQAIWVNSDSWEINPYFVEGKNDGERLLNIRPIYQIRDYSLFAVLANVRNYDKVVPIAEPRGLPADVSVQVKCDSDDDGQDGHSHSWLSLTELKTFTAHRSDAPQSLTKLIEKCESILKRIFYARTPEEIEELAHKLRIVFWFDN